MAKYITVYDITNHNNCIGVTFLEKGKPIRIQCRNYEPEYRFWKVHEKENSEYMFEILDGDRLNLKKPLFMGVSDSGDCLQLISENSDGDQQDERWFRYDTDSIDNGRRLMHINTQRYVMIQNKKLELCPQQPSDFSRSVEHLRLQDIPTWEIKPVNSPK